MPLYTLMPPMAGGKASAPRSLPTPSIEIRNRCHGQLTTVNPTSSISCKGPKVKGPPA